MGQGSGGGTAPGTWVAQVAQTNTSGAAARAGRVEDVAGVARVPSPLASESEGMCVTATMLGQSPSRRQTTVIDGASRARLASDVPNDDSAHETLRVAILGLGEAGGAFARGLVAAGAGVSGWDPDAAKRPEGVVVADGNPGAAADADVILSMNWPSVAREVAAEVAPVLREGQLYAEANTASPGLKRDVAAIVETRGARFVDVAIMAPVPPKGVRTPLWVAGSGAEAFHRLLAPLGLDVTVLAGDAGTAATRKLVRSIAYKGIAAVVMECLAAARALDLEEYARGQLATLVDEASIDHFEEGSRKHAFRRVQEMEAVVEMLEAIGVPARTSEASLRSLMELRDSAGVVAGGDAAGLRAEPRRLRYHARTMSEDSARPEPAGLEGYRCRAARALVIMHEREMRRFLPIWREADDAGIDLPRTDDPHYASRAHLLRHVFNAARGYMRWMTEKLDLPGPDIDEVPELEDVAERAEAYMEHLLERWRTPLADVSYEQLDQVFDAYWGEPYSIDSMLEHAVMHPARHAFQLEELLRRAKVG
jgi:3-hydroxyisobutyrate dehydrogenase-like beta-hydroxyacid dehydrogenase